MRPSGRGTEMGPSPTKPSDQPAQPTGGLPGQKLAGPTGGTNASPKGSDTGPRWGDDERDFQDLDWSGETVDEDERDLSWSAVLKRTFEAYVRGETPNMYGEWINWERGDDQNDEDGW
jgi:WD repeat and SOF domain-containing protein 1